LFSISSITLAAEHYASPTGDDETGSGSITKPYKTIQHVLDSVVSSGDTIILRGGTYNENIEIAKPNITIRSMSNEWAVIQSVLNDPEKEVAVSFDVSPEHSDRSRLENVEVVGGYWYGVKFETKWDWGGIDRSGASHITIQGCKIHDTGDACIKITPGCDDITIRQCEIYNSGRNDPDSAEGIDNVNGDRMLVEQCHLHDISATGLYAKGGAIGTRIERCLVEDCGAAGILVGFDTSPEWFDVNVNPEYYENIDGEVTNCIVVNTVYAGIGLYAAKNARVFNNSLVDVAKEGQSGLFFGITFQDWNSEANRPSCLNPIIRNNIVVESARANSRVVEIRWDDELGGLSGLSGMPEMSNNRYYVENGTAVFEDERPGSEFSGGLGGWKSHINGDRDSTEGDPAFIDPTLGDYHLLPTSACIDDGTSNGAPRVDFDGISRPQGNNYDPGALEYHNLSFPIPDIQVNGSDAPTVIYAHKSFSTTLSLASEDHKGQEADWWVAAYTPSGWLSLIYEQGELIWINDLKRCIQAPLISFASLEIPEPPISTGLNYIYFAVDDNADNKPDASWYDFVVVEKME
jgi:hypothetical protein